MSARLIRELKLVLVGGGGVGKSSITLRFINHQFLDEYDPTIEDSYRKPITIDDEPVVLDILDTAGQEEYGAMREQWYRAGDGFLLVFSLSSRSSFDEILAFHQALLRSKDREYVPCVIVCNKCDLEDERVVSSAEARSLAKQLHCAYVECSAKAGINMDICFQELVRLVRRDQKRIMPAMAEKKESISTQKTEKRKIQKRAKSDKSSYSCCVIA